MTTIFQDYPEYAGVDTFVAEQQRPLSVLRDRCVHCGGFGSIDYNDQSQRCVFCHGSGWIEYTKPQRKP